MQWAELIEELKTNVLRQPLRVRKLIMGEYNTMAGEHELAKVSAPLGRTNSGGGNDFDSMSSAGAAEQVHLQKHVCRCCHACCHTFVAESSR